MNKFNVRVYGIWIKSDKILLSHENIDGYAMTKFPGGGLEFGEGALDCLKREFMEELGVKISQAKLVHVSEKYIPSAFKKNEQVIAVHYLVDSDDSILNYENIQDTAVGESNLLSFKWHKLNPSLIDDLSFEMDKEAFVKI
ncbi:MAG: NUDIX domain-containing protein [Bacteroidia bacterium]|jgi:8-oxo-dGTP diphosphatase|nr:NUDIX domain-containing protein [Bacteroidia bacterium]